MASVVDVAAQCRVPLRCFRPWDFDKSSRGSCQAFPNVMAISVSSSLDVSPTFVLEGLLLLL